VDIVFPIAALFFEALRSRQDQLQSRVKNPCSTGWLYSPKRNYIKGVCEGNFGGFFMLSLQNYFSEVGAFPHLFEAEADEVQKSALVMMDLFKSSLEENLKSLSHIGQQNEQINKEIETLLCQPFVIPLEWEDIDTLSHVLYLIPKTIHKLSTRMLLSKSYLPVDFFDQPAKILVDATGVVQKMVRQLWHQPHLSQIKEENECLCSLEDEAEKLIFEMLCDLHSGKYETMQIIVLSNLFQLLEKAMDYCREACDVVYRIVLKNS
jgi:uncharacterized protein Yka (UPF0111/DUF47 family)